MLYDCRAVAERDRGIAAAVEAVKRGELVVLPTDTV
jgi:tRNA A37 threonylcarbamoyladenosine synthetase subunit TsaC/SUA5/YrdC